MTARAVAALAGGIASVAGTGCGATASSRAATAPPPAVAAVRVPASLSGDRATAFAAGAGRVLTVAHVLHRGLPVLVGQRRARILRVDRRLDVAVLAARGIAGPAPQRAPARARERVTVRAVRGSLRGTVRRLITARVKGIDGRVRVRPALELSVAVQPGDSGAPVLDARGRLVGMVFAQASGRDGLAYALDARALP